jgi:hypothetical protein
MYSTPEFFSILPLMHVGRADMHPARRGAARCNPETLMGLARQRTTVKVPMIKFDEMQKMSDATKNSLDAASQSAQAIINQIAEYTRRSVENGTKTLDGLLGAKSLDKVIEVQSDYAKAAYEEYVGHATKLGQLYSDLTKAALKPYEGFVSRK